MILKPSSTAKGPFPKFMFELDFDEQPRGKRGQRTAEDGSEIPEDAEAEEAMPEPEPEPAPPTFSEEDMARAREEGLAEGRRMAEEAAAGAVENRIADALSTMVQQVDMLFQAQAEANQEVTKNAVAVAASLVRKLFPTLNQETALDQMEAMLRKALGQVSGEPSIVIRTPADLAEAMHERVDAVVALSGFQGEVRVIGDASLQTGDCRLEWSSGGVRRSAAELARDLDDIIRQNLGGMPEDTAESTTEAPAPDLAQVDGTAKD